MKKFWNWVRDEDTDSRTLYLNGKAKFNSFISI
jgi:hypothetical protein